MEFRYDIQALRAFAVVIVIIFHANPNWMPGGFLGVDLFFTISGFIIFSLIHRQIEEKRFRLISFYKRRVIRLFPALFVTIAVTLIFSFVALPEDNFPAIVSSSIWSIVSLANIFFYLDSGYFSSSAIEKPFLHLWSLGVEEQFYLLFPLFVMSISRFSSRTKLALLIVISLLFAHLSHTCLETDPSASFFLTPLRIFQFTLGACVVFIPFRSNGQRFFRLSWFAVMFGLLYSCFFIFDKDSNLPGYQALAITMVMSYLLYSGRALQNSLIIKNKFVQSIGNSSYSLYLAHWPVAVLLSYQLAELPANQIGVIIVLVGLICGGILHLFVEVPYKQRSMSDVVKAPILPSIVVVSFCAVFSPFHSLTLIPDGSKEPAETSDGNFITIGEQKGMKVLLAGDSHASMINGYLKHLLLDPEKNLYKQTLQGCPSLLGVYKIYTQPWGKGREPDCDAKQNHWRTLLDNEEIDLVVISSRWELYFTDQVKGVSQPWTDYLVEDRSNTTEHSKEKNLKLLRQGLTTFFDSYPETRFVLVGQVPIQSKESVMCAKRVARKWNAQKIDRACGASLTNSISDNYLSITTLFKEVANKRKNVDFINPADTLCIEGYCSLVREHTVMYKDDNHLSPFGVYTILNNYFD